MRRLHPDQVPHDGATIPTLADVLRIDPPVRFNIELKTFPWHPCLAVDGAAMADAVVAVADARAPPTGSSCSRSTGAGRAGSAARDRRSDLAWLTSASSWRARGSGGTVRIRRISAARSRAPSRRRVGPPGVLSTTI